MPDKPGTLTSALARLEGLEAVGRGSSLLRVSYLWRLHEALIAADPSGVHAAPITNHKP
jgi:hypothetical protein